MIGEGKKGTGRARREFLGTATALTGAAIVGLPRDASAAKRHPKRGGTLRFGMREYSVGLDTHRSSIYFVSQPLAALTGGLLDFNAKMEPVAAIATEWDASDDLKTWTFKLRRGAEFHNGETIDAQAIKWNVERILDPKIGGSFTRSALTDVERVTVDDKYTVRFHLKSASASFDTPTSSIIPSTSWHPVRSTKPIPLQWAAGHSSSSRGSVSIPASWCASRISGRPTPRAIRCRISTASSASPKRKIASG